MLFDDNRKIGIGLCGLGGLLGLFGVLFFFDRVLLASANFSFIAGICLIVGPFGTARFFFKREKLKGSLCFFGGFLLIILRFPAILGIILQLYGVWLLFYALLPNILASAKMTPVGFLFDLPGIKHISSWIYDMRRLPL